MTSRRMKYVLVDKPFLERMLQGGIAAPHYLRETWVTSDAPADMQIVGFDLLPYNANVLRLYVESESFPEVPDGVPLRELAVHFTVHRLDADPVPLTSRTPGHAPDCECPRCTA